MESFSLNWPSGPMQSISHNVRLMSPSINLFLEGCRLLFKQYKTNLLLLYYSQNISQPHHQTTWELEVGVRLNVTCDTWHKTQDTWHITCNIFSLVSVLLISHIKRFSVYCAGECFIVWPMLSVISFLPVVSDTLKNVNDFSFEAVQ